MMRVVIINGSPRKDGATARILARLIRYSGAFMSGSIVCSVSFGSDPCGRRMNERICRISRRMILDIRKKRKYPFQSLFRRIVFDLGIRPFVRSQGKDYRGVTEKWESRGIKI